MVERKSYTQRDARQIKEELVSMIPLLTDDWTDFHESDPGMVIIELLSHLSDQLAFYTDRMAIESNFVTATERRNVFSGLRPLGYQLSGYVSARTQVRLRSSHSNEIYVKKYDIFATEEEDGEVYYFSAMHDLTIPPNLTETVTLQLIEGIKEEFEFDYDDIDSRERIEIPKKNIAENFISLHIDGEEWEEIQDAYFYEHLDPVFSVEYSRQGYPMIRLVKGWKDIVEDPEEVEIKVVGLESSGYEANIGSHTIIKIVSELEDEIGDTDCMNTIPDIIHRDTVSGGDDPETVEEARLNGPRRLRTMWTVVTLRDYEDFCETQPGIDRCLALDWSVEDTYIDDPYEVDVIIVPTESDYSSQAMKDDLYRKLMERRVTPTHIYIKDPNYVDFDIEVTGYVIPGYDHKDHLKFIVRNHIDEYFKAENREFGETIRPVSLRYYLESNIEDLMIVDVDEPEFNTVLEINQFPRLSSKRVNIVEEEVI